MAAPPDYYEVLQVSPNAEDEIVQAAYRRLSLRWHPDRNPGDPLASERMRLLNEAYEVLSDPLKRREYDARRGTARPNRESGGGPSHPKAKASPPPNEHRASPAPGPAACDAQASQEDGGNSIAWALLALGIFVFVTTHAFDFASHPAAFLLGCATWGVVFGLPAYLCFRYRKRIGAIVVATLFLLASVLNAASNYKQSLAQDRIESLQLDTAFGARRTEPAKNQNSPKAGKDSTITKDLMAAAATSKDPPTDGTSVFDRLESAGRKAAAEDPPRDAKDYFKRGLASAGKGDYDEAIRDYNAAIRLDPNNAEYRFLCGDAWFKKEQYPVAIAHYNDAIRLDPNHADWYVWRGFAWSRMKDDAKARKDFDEARRLDPERYK